MDEVAINNIFKQKADYYENAIKAFDFYRNAAINSKIDLFVWLGDISMFTILVSYDLWILQLDYQKAIKKYQQNFYARQSALLCFELLSDIPQNTNEKYQKLLIELIDSEEINERAKTIREKLNTIRNENEKKYKEIRDLTAAHREHKISKLISVINSMDNEGIMNFALEYMKVIEELDYLLNDAIQYLKEEQIRIGNQKFYTKYT